ncbi:glycosyltransferase [Gynurincola endophyticus]|uniref:glycosyltransferase n=1 Tax=Gynurincola endophyticus TaxID=2479004 RepID=UPI000F8D6C80|nr:glycosyltransferase [Gynurincola endophyticus]
MIYFLLCFLLMMVIYTYKIFRYQSIWESIPVVATSTGTLPRTGITIIVAARNEELYIGELLNACMRQNYPKELYEVIIIDDHSTDRTASIIQSYVEKFSNIRYVSLAEYTHLYPPTLAFKKLALTIGVKLSKHHLIVCTDADCVVPENWLAIYDQTYQQQQWQFIVAPVRLITSYNSVDIFQSLDFLTLQGITGAAVANQLHAMCNGANLAFTKQAFERVNGYEGIDHIPSGDDLLLMHKIVSAYPKQYGYIKSGDAIVDTHAPKTWKDLFQQRIRWASKTGHYQDKSITSTLILVFLINLCFVILAFCSLFAFKWFTFFCLLLFAKVLIEYPFIEAVARFFQRNRYLKFFPIMQVPHIFYTVSAGMLGKLKHYQWKGRTIPTK